MKRFLIYTLLIIVLATACQPTEKIPSPVDQQLIYIASRGNGFDIYKCNQDGTAEQQLTTQRGFDWGPRWWPAQSGILHYSQDTSNNFAHKLIGLDGKEMPMDFQELSDFIASPDGRYALYTEKVGEKDHIFLQDLEARTATDISPTDAYHGRAQWSPDSQSIALISDRDGSNELYLYQMSDQSITQLTEGEGRAKYHSWSPDGQRIAFTREVLEEPKKEHDIFVLELATRTITQLTDTPWAEQEISWSPMGDKIAYHGTIDGKDDIYTLDLESKEVVKITQSQGYHGEPAWVPVYK